MKKSLLLSALFGLGIVFSAWAQLSTNKVKFQVTYSATNQTYTAWVVPEYSTPNSNNPAGDEFGATAQFSMRIPRGFSITEITDVRGVWEKNPFKLDLTNPIFTSNGITGPKDYYVIGKSPIQTNYGPFVANQPVALFTFKGTQPGALVEVLPNSDPFVQQAIDILSLNVGCSFYSRSGQPLSPDAIPLEQFSGVFIPSPVITETPHPVKFMLTYSKSTKLFTVWVVPSYDTPNIFNSLGNEFGATAQVTLQVDKKFDIQEIINLNGNWQNPPSKIEAKNPLVTRAGIKMKDDLYVIGKSPIETNYGPFKANTPVALFSIRSRSGKEKDIELLDKDDKLIAEFNEKLALNIGNSFYSRSGQPLSQDAIPLEQFDGVIDQKKLLKDQMNILSADESALFEVEGDQLVATIYPNPTDDMVQIDYFSDETAGPIRAVLMNPRGGMVSQQVKSASMGIHQFQFQLSGLEGGQYLIGIQTGDRMIMKRFVKR